MLEINIILNIQNLAKKKNILVFLSLNLNFKRNSKFFYKHFIKNKKNNEEEDSDK
jgi:hypothetical protein